MRGLRYYINWQNVNGDLLTVNIYKKDYSGVSSQLTATDKPFVLSKQEENPIAAIQSTRAEIEYYNDGGTPLSTFFSEDAEMWSVDFTKRDGTVIWKGLLIQDDMSEEFQSTPYRVQLSANDGIPALKDVPFNTAADIAGYTDIQTCTGTLIGGVLRITSFPIDPAILPGDILTLNSFEYEIASTALGGSANRIDITLVTFPTNGVYTVGLRIRQNYLSRISLFSYLRIALANTGLELDIRVFFNYFDATHDERDVMKQTRVYSGRWLSTDGIWTDCYQIIDDIFTALNCSLIQADGYWNLIHRPELYLWTDNEIAGFLNDAAISISPNYSGDLTLIDANAVRKITGSYNTVKETFNYDQPTQLLKGSDLKTLGSFIGFTVVGDLRYDKYNIPGFWRHLNNEPYDYTFDGSYIVIVTDTTNDTEVERYIYQPWIDRTQKFLEFNPIEVSKGDVMDLSFSILFQTTDGSDTAFFSAKILLITPSGSLYEMFMQDGGTPQKHLDWAHGVTNDPATVNSTWKGIRGNSGIVYNQDTVNAQQWSLSSITVDPAMVPVPAFPEDGILLICISGVTTPETGGGVPACDMSFKDIQFSISSKVNDSTKIIGHSHLQDAQTGAKKKYDEEIKIDDSPRNPIAGTLFNDVRSDFAAEIGSVYFGKTGNWGFFDSTKDKRIGYIMTTERQAIFSKARMRIEGAFLFELSLSMLSVFFFPSLPTFNFILGVVSSLDYMQMRGEGEFNEIYETGESFTTYLYTFAYIYESK